MNPAKGQADEGLRASVIQGEVETAGIAELGEEKALEGPYQCV